MADHFGIRDVYCRKGVGTRLWDCDLRFLDGNMMTIPDFDNVQSYLSDRVMHQSYGGKDSVFHQFGNAGANCGIDGTTHKNLTCRRRVQGSADMCPPI